MVKKTMKKTMKKTAAKTKTPKKRSLKRGNPFTCDVLSDSIEIRKGRDQVLVISQGHDDIQPESGPQRILQIGLVFDDNEHSDPADFMVQVMAVEQEREKHQSEGYTLLIPEVEQIGDWPTIAELSEKNNTSWAVKIEDAIFETFKSIVQQLSEVDDPNPHLKDLIPYAHEFEPQVRALARRVMVNQVLRYDPFIGSVFDHCAQEIVESFVDDVHDL